MESNEHDIDTSLRAEDDARTPRDAPALPHEISDNMFDHSVLSDEDDAVDQTEPDNIATRSPYPPITHAADTSNSATHPYYTENNTRSTVQQDTICSLMMNASLSAAPPKLTNSNLDDNPFSQLNEDTDDFNPQSNFVKFGTHIPTTHRVVRDIDGAEEFKLGRESERIQTDVLTSFDGGALLNFHVGLDYLINRSTRVLTGVGDTTRFPTPKSNNPDIYLQGGHLGVFNFKPNRDLAGSELFAPLSNLADAFSMARAAIPTSFADATERNDKYFKARVAIGHLFRKARFFENDTTAYHAFNVASKAKYFATLGSTALKYIDKHITLSSFAEAESSDAPEEAKRSLRRSVDQILKVEQQADIVKLTAKDTSKSDMHSAEVKQCIDNLIDDLWVLIADNNALGNGQDLLETINTALEACIGFAAKVQIVCMADIMFPAELHTSDTFTSAVNQVIVDQKMYIERLKKEQDGVDGVFVGL